MRRFTDVIVTGHGMRSITSIPYPLPINMASFALVKELPGISRKVAASVIAGLPYIDRADFIRRVNEGEKLEKFIEI